MATSRRQALADPLVRGGKPPECQRCLGLTDTKCPVVLRCHGCGFRCHPHCTYPPLRCPPRKIRHWLCDTCAQERHAKIKVPMHYNFCIVCGTGGDLVNKCVTCRHTSHAKCEPLHQGRCTLCARNLSERTKRLELYNWAMILARQKERRIPVIQGERIEFDASGTKLRGSIWGTSEIIHALTEKLVVTRGGSVVRLRGRYTPVTAESACGGAAHGTKECPHPRVMELFENGLPWDRWQCILSYCQSHGSSDSGIPTWLEELPSPRILENRVSRISSQTRKRPRQSLVCDNPSAAGSRRASAAGSSGDTSFDQFMLQLHVARNQGTSRPGSRQHSVSGSVGQTVVAPVETKKRSTAATSPTRRLSVKERELEGSDFLKGDPADIVENQQSESIAEWISSFEAIESVTELQRAPAATRGRKKKRLKVPRGFKPFFVGELKMSIGFRVERKFLEGWLQGSVVEVGQHKFENAALVEFHHDDCTYEDILSETDFGRFMGAGSLRLDPPVEEDKSTVASAAEKKRPKARARARRGSSTEPQETQIERDADGWTKEEVDRLLTAVDNEELVNQGFWKRIAKAVGTKTAKECNRRYCRGSKKSPAPHRNKPPGPRTRPQSDDDGEIGADDCATDVPYKKDGVRRFRAIQQYMTDHQFVNKEEDLLMDGLVAGDLGDLPLSDSDSEISWDMNDIKIGGTPKAEARHKSTRRNSVDSVSSLADNSEYDPFTYAQPYEQRVDPTSYTLCQTLHRQRQALLEGHRNRTLGLDIGNVRPPYACQPIITEDDEDGDECLVEALEKVDQRNRLERQREKYVNSDGELDEDFFSDDQEVI